MLTHDLFDGVPPPSAAQLRTWAEEHGIDIHPGVAIQPVPGGWGLFATTPLDIGQTICKIPKPALLSIRNCALPVEVDHSSASAILGLSLCLLHELRLGPASKWWGYLQSLPRYISIPPLWSLGGEDERTALEWLKGTEADRDLLRREREGFTITALRAYYEAHPLPATERFPSPSSFGAFLHAFAIVSTRAFIVDMYHLVALTPFADVLNHASSDAHTSLASDDFVCHVCGVLPECEHDMPYPGRPPARLAHLDPIGRARLETQMDTVDMYVETPVAEGEEVMNSYGDGVGDARLLVEWGFVPDDGGEGEVCTFSVGAGVGEEEEEVVVQVEEDEDALLFNGEKASVNSSGQVSVRLFAGVYAGNEEDVKANVLALEGAWRALQAEKEVRLSPVLRTTAERVRDLLKERLGSTHRPELGVAELYDLRLALDEEQPCQAMALTIAMDERALLGTALERWELLLEHK